MADDELISKTPQKSAETALTQDVLKNALAFSGSSSKLFNDAVSEVRTLVANSGDQIYPPNEYPTWRSPKEGSTLQTTHDSSFVGRLTQAEAVGVRVLQEESMALLQSFGRSDQLAWKIDEILGTGKKAWQSDAMEGIVSFNHMVGMASGVRERLLSGLGPPGRKTIGDLARLAWYESFSPGLEADGLKIGGQTAACIVAEIAKHANEEIPHNPEGARNADEIQARIAGRIRGAELAKALYLETIGLASNIFPATIEPKPAQDL